MRKTKSIAIAQDANDHNYSLIVIFAWASLFSVTASSALIAAAIFIH